MITPTIAIRRLRAERRGLDTSAYPPRVRGRKARLNLDPKMHRDFERAWTVLLWPAAQFMAWPSGYRESLRYISWLAWREARKGLGK